MMRLVSQFIIRNRKSPRPSAPYNHQHLSSIQTHHYLRKADTFPAEYECAQPGPNNDANNKIPVEIHSQQHNEVCYGELHHMKSCPDNLLKNVRPEAHRSRVRQQGSGVVITPTIRIAFRSSDGLGGEDRSLSDGVLVLAQDVTVVFLACSAKEFQRHDEKNDADAGTCEHSVGRDVP